MADVRVKLLIGGVRKMLRSAEVQAELVRRGRHIQDAAGEGFELVVKPHRYTARVFVQAGSADAARREAEDKVLTRALDAGR